MSAGRWFCWNALLGERDYIFFVVCSPPGGEHNGLAMHGTALTGGIVEALTPLLRVKTVGSQHRGRPINHGII